MAIKLTKFPVTTADGTEYRVSIMEDGAGDYVAHVYVERKPRLLKWLLRFKRVSISEWFATGQLDDFVTAAKCAVKKYDDGLCRKAERVRKFAEWDGVIRDA